MKYFKNGDTIIDWVTLNANQIKKLIELGYIADTYTKDLISVELNLNEDPFSWRNKVRLTNGNDTASYTTIMYLNFYCEDGIRLESLLAIV